MLFDLKELKNNLHTPIRGIIHVGAHKAEELSIYKELGVNKTIWVEANPNLLGDLINKTIMSSGQSIHLAIAHEEDHKIMRLNVANNGESSSILDLDYHKIAHPHIHYTGHVDIPTRRIDSIVIDGGYDVSSFNFMNIDVQGAELHVLKGSKQLLEKSIDFIYTEVNEKSLYKDCALTSDLDKFLQDFGIRRAYTKMTQYGWGDALYVKA